MAQFRPLTTTEVATLEAAGCSSSDWNAVSITDDVDVSRIHAVGFRGRVRIEALNGNARPHGEEPIRAFIARARIENCHLGRNVRINDVFEISDCTVGDEALIANCGTIRTKPGATFGNGVEVETLNEGGGRVVRLFDDLTAQIAYFLAVYRYRPRLVERLEKAIDAHVASVRSDRGRIGSRASVRNVPEMVNVRIGDCAHVVGASRIDNATILSEEAAPTTVGSSVIIDNSIVAEGAKIDSGALLDKCFVGQATKLGKTFSAENCLFFANCEGFHSEAVAVFGGPYTVTHHRSTLLIAAMYSFYNAGSATNSSNHMYKLGPVHQGTMERGSKTASGSYMLWPCVVGPFTVVMGKNMANFDVREFPFSYVSAEAEGSTLTPGMNMFTVGTTRDGEKWPSRDRRKAGDRRDLIRFEVFSPFTVGRMIAGEKVLLDLAENTPKETKIVRYKGVTIKRLLLRTGAKNYTGGIDRYLMGEILKRAEPAAGNGQWSMRQALAPAHDANPGMDWCDVAGMLVCRARLEDLLAAIESGAFATIADIRRELRRAWEAYESDAWAWVRERYAERTGKSVDDLTSDDLASMRDAHSKAVASFTKKLLADAEKEFDEGAQLGFGIDSAGGDIAADFSAVRGTFAGNGFVKGLKKQLEAAATAKV